MVKNPPTNSGDGRGMGLIPGLGQSPGRGHGNPLQYSCLGNPMDRGTWWAAVHWVTKELDTTERLNNKKRINKSHSQLRGCTKTGSLAFACGLSFAQLCLTLCDPVDCSPPCSSVHGIPQARILEWIAISFSRVSSQSRDQTTVSRMAGRHFTI